MKRFRSSRTKPAISAPENPAHVTHVGYDQETGEFTGLPGEWRAHLEAAGITEEGWRRNQREVIDIVDLWNKESRDDDGDSLSPTGPVSDTFGQASTNLPLGVSDAMIEPNAFEDPRPAPPIPASGPQAGSSDRKFPNDDFIKALNQILPRPWRPVSASDSAWRLREAEYDRVSDLLKLWGKLEWSLRPRTFIVLYIIGLEMFMDAFVEENKFDSCLPYERGSLPDVLTEDSRERFLAFQHHVLPDSAVAEIERGGGRHQVFDQAIADNTFRFVKKLGGTRAVGTRIDHVVGKLTRNHFALKTISTANWPPMDRQRMQLFTDELDKLKTLSHRHIVRLIGSFTDPNCIGILMQPVEQMNLAIFLAQKLPETENLLRNDQIRRFFGCLATAVDYLHNNSHYALAHKDIKPENILVRDGRVFLTGFGTSVVSSHYLPVLNTDEPTFTKAHHATVEAWIINKDTSNDIWSLGCVFLEMCSSLAHRRSDYIAGVLSRYGSKPIPHQESENTLQSLIEQLKRPLTSSNTLDVGILDVVTQMCRKDPGRRITAHNLVTRIFRDCGDRYICSDCYELLAMGFGRETRPHLSLETLDLQTDSWAASTEHNQSESFHDSGYSSMKREEVTEDEDDRVTIVSFAETLRLDDETKVRSIAEFVRELATDLEIRELPSALSTAITIESLKAAIRTFSQALAKLARPGVEMGACAFFRQQRQRIATELLFNQLTSSLEPNIETPPRARSPGLSAADKVLWWFKDARPSEDVDLPAETLENDTIQPLEDEEADPIPYFGPTKTFVKKSSAYDWLLKQTKRLLRPELGLRSCAATIGPQLSANDSSIRIAFVVHWNPVPFLQFQYGSNDLFLLHRVITLTSNGLLNQATTCSEYLLQTWPSTGLQVLDAIIAGFSKEETQVRINNNKQWTVSPIDEFSIEVLVEASSELVLDTAEQLCWLGAACRASAEPDEMCITKPLLSQVESSDPRTSHLHGVPLFSIAFEEARLEETNPNQGFCWMQLFRNPSIAAAFPVHSRPFGGVGLEISLRMMSVLGEADRLKSINGMCFLKGFRSVFFPTNKFTDCIMWHFEVNKDGSYMPFKEIEDDSVPVHRIDGDIMLKCRHFVGWVPAAKSNLGAQEVDYESIRSTKVLRSGPGCALLNATVSGGKVITGELNFSRGVKDEAVWASADRSYSQKVHQMRTIYVNLFDDKERRGSLVDGASAILHLVRAQLCVQPYKDSAFLRLKEFKHADNFKDTNGSLSAEQKALLDKDNRGMSYDEDFEYSREDILVTGPSTGQETAGKTKRITKIWTIEHLICQLWEILDDLRRHQRKIRPVHLRGTTREKLEGWSMKQIIDIHPEIDPRVLHLKPSSRGWVDFLREINAVTLFARNLGDLIVPAPDIRICRSWKRVPEGSDLLAVKVQTLRAICEEYGDEDESPPRLTQSIIWHQPHMLFESCKCPDTQSKFINKQCERVQVLLPKLSLGPKTSPQPWNNLNGAVVFGRSERFKISWPIRGSPVEGDMPDDTPDQEQFDDKDSGLGTSLGSSG